MANEKDRRKHPRVGAKNPDKPVTSARFYLLSDARKSILEAPVLDVSLGGLSLMTQLEIPVGATLQLLVEPYRAPGVESTMGGAYRLLAEVRWGSSRKEQEIFILGLMFLPVSIAESRNRKGLQRIMDSYQERHGSA